MLYLRGRGVSVMGPGVLYLRGGGGVMGLGVLYLRGRDVGVVGDGVLSARRGRGGGVSLDALSPRGKLRDAVGLAIASLRDAGARYSLNIRGLRRNGVCEGLGI